MVNEFLKDRLRTLRPINDVASPFAILAELTTRKWLYLLLGFLGWAMDALDYYSITTVIPELTIYFGKTPHTMTLGLTISLIPRFLGAGIFGIAGDHYGRKWPFVVDCVLLSALELSLAFCTTYTQFIVCRALFGVAMGGMYGNAAATALEDCPPAARGLVAGIFQSGYPMGFLLTTAFWTAFDVGQQDEDWKHLFYFASCLPLLLIVFRLLLPETTFFQEIVRREHNSESSLVFMGTLKEAIVLHWKRLLYLIAFMFGCTLLTHGAEDVFPLLLENQHGYSSNEVTATQSVAFVGGVIGSWLVGFGSQITGRRFTIITTCLLGAILIYPYCFVSGPSLYPVAFLELFMINGIFGIVPIHLIELSPLAFSTFIIGTSYNLGVLLASWAPVVEALIGEKRIETNGKTLGGYQYSQVMGAVLGSAFIYLIAIAFLGPENRQGSRRAAGPTDGGSSEDEISVHSMIYV